MMKRRILAALLASVLVVLCLCSICFVSCNKGDQQESKYLLKFKSDGVNYDVVIVGADNAIVLPQDPKKSGYSFAGWYLDDGTWNRPFDPSEKISANTEVYAKWTRTTFTISYELNGGAYAGAANPSEYSVESDDVVLLPLVRDGYAFDGWFLNGNYVERIKKGTTGNLTLSAKWVKDGYTITYTNVKGAENNNPRAYTVSDNAISLAPLEKIGYTFDGWYIDNTKHTQIPANSTGNLTLEARWSLVNYTLTFDLNGGSYAEGGSNPVSYTIESEDITLNPAVRKGYAFDGWYVGGNAVSTIKKGTTGNLTLSAKWVKDGYTITYINVKGVENNNPRTYTVSDNAISLAPLEKIGYTFDGWYIDDTKYTQIPANSTGNLTLEAKWSLVNYSITYLDPEGNVLNVEGFDLPISYTIESETIVLNDYYVSGYRFDGWSDEDGISVKAIRKGSYGNVVLYATLESLSLFEICYDDPFGRLNVNPLFAEYGETVQLMPLKKADYDFVGWTLNGSDIIQSVDVYSNTMLFAVWERKAGLEDFDYIVDDDYVGGHNKDGFIMLLNVLNPFATELVIPDCVSMVRSGLLRNCNSLESLTLPFLGESAQSSAMTSHLAFLFGGSSYADNTTCVPQSLKNLVINGGEVADYALFGCEYLEKLIFNDGVTRIGDSAVGNCKRLKELQVPFIGEKYCEDDDYNGISCAFPDNARPVYIFGGRYKTEQFPKALEKLTITKGYAPDPIYYSDRDKATRFYTISQLSKLKEFDYASVNEYLYDHMFENMAKIEKLTIRGNVKKIGFFYGYTYAADYIREVNIPNTVTEISEKSFMSFKSLPKISLPNVRVIPAQAFMNCARLNSIEFCSELTSIGNEAFSGCSSLFSITVPQTVASIGTDAFKDCTNLLEVYNLSALSAEKGSDDLGGLCKNAWEVNTSKDAVGKFQNINGCVVYDKDGEKMLMKYIGDSAEVNIPDGVTVIYANAFTDCSSITSVTMPDSVKTVQNNAFDSCTHLVSAKMSNGITSAGLGNNVFINCASLANVTLPSSIETIPEGMFEGCTNLASIEIPASVKTVSGRAFYQSGIADFDFSRIVSIEEAAFQGTKLVQIAFPDSLITIGNNAFNACAELTTVTFGSKLETIGDSAFRICSKLNNVVLPESLTTLGGYAFYECSALTSVVIPSKVTDINTYTFGLCTSLSDVTLNDNVKNILYGAFFRCAIVDLVWPSKLEKIDASVFRYNRLEKVVLPDSVKSIGAQAFGDMDTLTELIIPKTTETMASDVASGSYNITKLAVPFVGRVCDIFGNVGKAYALTSLIIYGGDVIRRQKDLYSNDYSTFGHPNTRDSVNYFQSLTSITFGEDVKTIEDGALFNLPALKTLILPSATYSTSLKNLFGEERTLDVLGFTSGDVSADYVSGITAGKWLFSKDVTNPGIPANATVLFAGTFEEWDALTFENKNTCKVYYYSQDEKRASSWRYTFNGVALPEIW